MSRKFGVGGRQCAPWPGGILGYWRADACLRLLGCSLVWMVSACSGGEDAPPAFPIADASRYAADLALIAQAPRTQTDENHQQVQDLCAARFAELGYDVERYDYGGGVDVIGTIPGTVRSDEVVVVSAHYDTVAGSHGADDNASGVAAVLESARLLSAGERERTLVMACWDQEEPALRGSYMYAVRARENNLKIHVAFVYDQIGYADHAPNSQDYPKGLEIVYPLEAIKARLNQFRGDFVLLVFDSEAARWARGIADSADRVDLPAMQMEIDISGNVPVQVRGSDHQSFWSQGYGAVEITDTAGYRNPYRHTDKDTIGTLDNDFSIKVISATAASARTALNP
jgi:Zn-dependent M28 family amino/carboxypeptidase